MLSTVRIRASLGTCSNQIGGRMLDWFYMETTLLYTQGLVMTGKPIIFMLFLTFPYSHLNWAMSALTSPLEQTLISPLKQAPKSPSERPFFPLDWALVTNMLKTQADMIFSQELLEGYSSGPRAFLKFKRFSFVKGFVNLSAICSEVGTYFGVTNPLAIFLSDNTIEYWCTCYENVILDFLRGQLFPNYCKKWW